MKVAGEHCTVGAEIRAYARVLELLIEKCDIQLQKSKDFIPAEWRSYAGRPSWADGKRGWTGLRPEEMDVRTVDTAKTEVISSIKIKGVNTQAVLSAHSIRGSSREQRIGEEQLMPSRTEEIEDDTEQPKPTLWQGPCLSL